MSRDPLDDLTQALAVEPSAEFVATVRRRAASEPMRRNARAFWLVPAGVVVGACVVIVVSIPRQPVSSPTRAMLPASPLRIEPVTAVAVAPPRALLQGEAPAIVRRMEPEVLVPRGQEAALIQLARVLEREGTDASSLIAAMPDSSTLGMHLVLPTELDVSKER